MYFSDMTDHPLIFKNAYWGGFETRTNQKNAGMDEVFANRNEFVREFSLVRCSRIPQYARRHAERTRDDWMDHAEFYKDSNGKYVVVVSPYKEHDDLMFRSGWHKYKPLYAPHAHTYVKRIDRSTPPIPAPMRESYF